MMKKMLWIVAAAVGLSACVSRIPSMDNAKKEMTPLQRIIKEDPKTACEILIKERSGWQKSSDGYCTKHVSM